MDKTVIDGALLREMVEAAASLLDANKQKLNDLNVFPVPDGDTGTNMSLTMQSVVHEVLTASGDSLPEISKLMSRGALKGARGNSGVILSQILRGLAAAFSGTDTADGDKLTEGFRTGADTAYKAVMKPKEGTILTVIRVIAEQTKKNMKGRTPAEVMDYAISVGEETLAKTPDMLPQLKKAGVVDAGGQGLITILHAFASVLHGEALPEDLESFRFTSVDESISRPTAEEVAEMDEIRFAYCTEFFIQQLKPTVTEQTVDRLRNQLAQIGDSLVVVGDPELVKVHVHTNEPGRALQLALELGELYRVKIENMVQQHRELLEKQAAENQKDVGIVAVASGEGLSALFRDLGADVVVTGGQTMNPSTADLAEAVRQVPAKSVIILPNNGNIILAAQQVKDIVDKAVSVIHTKSLPQGISAMLSFDPEQGFEENTEALKEGFASVVSGSVTYAVRDTEFDGNVIHENDVLALMENDIVLSCRDRKEAMLSLCEKMLSGGRELLTVYYGCDVSEEEANETADELRAHFADAEIELVSGGQPVYYYLLSAE